MCARASFLSPSLYPPYFARVLSFSLQTREGTREKEREREKVWSFSLKRRKTLDNFFLAKKKTEKKIHGKIDTDIDTDTDTDVRNISLSFFLSFFLSFERRNARELSLSFFLSFFLSRATVVVVVRRRRNGKRKLESWGAAGGGGEAMSKRVRIFAALLFVLCVDLFATRDGHGGVVVGEEWSRRRNGTENEKIAISRRHSNGSSYRRALLQRGGRVCNNPWCFYISKRQRVKIRQCALPACAVRVKPFSCSQPYCCSSWCRNVPWELLIDAPPPLCRDCIIAYRPGCCGWCEQVPSRYYGGVAGCLSCASYAVEVRFVPIIKPIYGRCTYCEWSPKRYISSPTFVNVINNNVNININIFQKTIVKPPPPKERLGVDGCRDIGGCGFDAPIVDQVPADEPLTQDEADVGDPQPGDVPEEQLTDAALDPIDDPVTAGEGEPETPDPVEDVEGIDIDGEGEDGSTPDGTTDDDLGTLPVSEEEEEEQGSTLDEDEPMSEPEGETDGEGTLPDVEQEDAFDGIDEGVDEQTDFQEQEEEEEGESGEQDYSSEDYSSQDYSSQQEGEEGEQDYSSQDYSSQQEGEEGEQDYSSQDYSSQGDGGALGGGSALGGSGGLGGGDGDGLGGSGGLGGGDGDGLGGGESLGGSESLGGDVLG